MALNLSTNRVKRKFTLTTMTLAVFALVAQPLVALNIPAAFATGSETLYVDPLGDNSLNCKDPLAPCRTVSKAVENANSGDTISVGAGPYVENVTIDKSVAIKGDPGASISGQVKIENGAQDVELSGLNLSHSSAVVKVPSGVSLSSLKLHALNVTSDKAIYIADGTGSTVGTLSITNSTINSNYAVYVDHAVANTVITGNTFNIINGNRGVVFAKQASSATVDISANTFNMSTDADADSMNFVKYTPVNVTLLNSIKDSNYFTENGESTDVMINGVNEAIVYGVAPDTTAPTADLTVARGVMHDGMRFVRSGDTIKYKIVANDNESGLDRASYKVFKLKENGATHDGSVCGNWPVNSGTSKSFNGGNTIEGSFTMTSCNGGTAVEDRLYGIGFNVYDKAGNTTRIPNSVFAVDGEKPTVTDFKIDNQSAVYAKQIKVSAVADDNNKVNGVKFFLTAPRASDGKCDGNGAKIVSVDGTLKDGRYEAVLDTDGLDGNYCVNAQSQDLVKNHSYIARQAVVIDTTAPKPSDVTISLMKNPDGTNFTSSKLGNGYLTVRFKTDEPLKLVGSQIGFQIPGMAGPPATGWTPVSLVDAATNTYEAKISLVNRTNTNVPGYEGFFNDKYFEGVKLYFRMVDSLNNVDSVYYYANGTFGKSSSKAYAFTLDNKMPEVSKAELYKNGDRVAKVKAGDIVNVKVIASDTASGIDTVVASVYTCPGGNTKRLMPNTRVEMTHVGDGIYELNDIKIPAYYYDHKGDLTSTSTEGGACVVVYATDKAGNEKKATTLYFSVDNTAPSITKYSYSNDGKVTPDDVTVTIETSEPVDTPDDWDKVDSTHFTKVFTQNGGFEVTLTDEAGNTATVGGKSQGAEVKGIDKVAPVFNIENEEVFNTSPVLVSVAENNLKTVTVNGDAVTSFLRNKPYEFDVAGDGVYKVVATDKANHESTVTFTIDTTPPALNDIKVSGSGNERIISGTTEPGAKVFLSVDGTIYELVASENGSWSQLINVFGFDYGVYPYSAYAEDAHGNASDTQTGNIVVPNPGARQGVRPTEDISLNFQANRAAVATTPGQLTAPAVDAEQDIRGAQDTAKVGTDTAVLAASDQGWKLFDTAWYWWLLVVAALAGAWWFIAGLRRRRQAEETL